MKLWIGCIDRGPHFYEHYDEECKGAKSVEAGQFFRSASGAVKR